MKVVEKAILSTDLALYFRKKNVFHDVANSGEIDWQEGAKKDRKLSNIQCGCKLAIFLLYYLLILLISIKLC